MIESNGSPTESNVVRIGVLGCGNVGAALIDVVRTRADAVEQRTGIRLEIARVAVRNMSAPRDVEVGEDVLTRDAMGVVTDPGIDIVVESIGGIEPARELILAALADGKPVVTANKELLANVGAELYAAADEAERDLLFEAAVAAGIPFIRVLRESLYGEPITRILGIINGTTNYILTKMTAFIDRDPDGEDLIANPSNPAENFADRWKEHPERRAAFFEWHEQACLDLSLVGGGQYALVLEGAVMHRGDLLATHSCLYRYPHEDAISVTAGTDGATVLLLQFPQREPLDPLSDRRRAPRQ